MHSQPRCKKKRKMTLEVSQNVKQHPDDTDLHRDVKDLTVQNYSVTPSELVVWL